MTTHQAFIDYLTKLAPAGETLLFVQQKPIVKNGEPQYHADGTPKYTWPAYLPTKFKFDGATYVNTGSFVIDRFIDGKPSASAGNCDYVAFLMLDDIGSKSKKPPLEPTWILETSPNNYQYGYVFSDQPTKGDFTAAIRAIADAGYTDPGATNAVRNVRLPGSINLKPGRDNFEAKLVEFHPEREFTLPEICEALGVVPAEADTVSERSIRLADNGVDTVLTWLNENGMVMSNVNNEGWLAVLCPNHAKHTTGQSEARYKPLDRSFCCYHANCQDLDTNTFLKWVADNGGPRVTAGLRDELLAEVMEQAMSKLTPNEEYPDVASEIVQETERKELGRVERAQWYERFAYLQTDEAFFDMQDRREISRAAFNALFRHITCFSIHQTTKAKRRVEASICFDENRQAMGAKALLGVTYAAGENVLVSRDGDVYGNRWRDARPDVSAITGRDSIKRWLDHCELMVPDPMEREHCFDIMAYKVQHPNVKINHAVLHVGNEGCGKDTMWEPMKRAIGGNSLANVSILDNDKIHNQFDYALECEVLILNELREPEAKERRALANKLKPIIAAPPELLSINRKGLHPYQMLNRVFVLAFSNYSVPISLDSQDRRWFCVKTNAPRMTADDGRDMWKWFNSGAFASIAKWLHDRDVSHFNPGAAPPMTEYKYMLIEQGMSMAESYLVGMMRDRVHEFKKGVIAAPFHALCDRLTAHVPAGVKVPQAALLHALTEAGWVDCGRLMSREYTTKKHIFAAPEVYAALSKSELRRAVEVDEIPEKVKI